MPAEEEFGFYNQLLLKLTICGGGSVMGWLLLESLLLALHLLCVNVAAGAPLIVAWFEWKWPADPLARRAGDYLSLAAWPSLLVGASLGLIIGWLRWNEEAAKGGGNKTEADAFAKMSDEDAFFAVDNSIPCMTGRISYVDTMSGGSDLPSSSKVTFALNANKLTKQQIMSFHKLWLVAVGPTNDE